MAYDFNRTHIKQIDDVCFTPLCLLGCKEGPFTVTDGSKITFSYPISLFVLVSSISPHPEVFEGAIVDVVKGFLGARVAMVVGPSSHHRVELT